MKTEGQVQQHIRLDAVKVGTTLWRNNNGACLDDTGRLIRYGLGNDSEKINKVIKSSDLIGITPILITPDMVGQVVGVFTAIEVKRESWNPHMLTDREEAQLNFINHVIQKGGYGGFATSPEQFRRIVRR